ncbi:hypothetical protein B7494_g2238 [Chlorociboria aeruginascens]|nr:hypothetical protein B7494_g2238 [Chlorociboria aeruginascens]
MSSSRRSHKSDNHKHRTNPSLGRSRPGQSEPAPQPVTFLFSVNSISIDDDFPREVDENGRWRLPLHRDAFLPQVSGDLGDLYRWSNGNISRADGYQWYQGHVWYNQSNLVHRYKTATMFFWDQFLQFATATKDASTSDMATAPIPDNRWYPLNFRHDGGLSRVDEVGEYPYLAGQGASWVPEFGLQSYNNTNSNAPISTGLAGNITTIVGLIALSCPEGRLDNVLMTQRAWRHYEWRGHPYGSGRTNERGVVVSIFLDPENPQWSTTFTLEDLEWRGGALIR